MTDSEWHELKLDPYREARLTTIRFRGPDIVASALRFKTGILIVLLSLPLWGGNLLRLLQTPPAAQIKVDSHSYRENEIRLVLTIQDKSFALRGFEPMNFQLAGERGTPITQPPFAVLEKMPGNGVRDVRLNFPRDEKPHQVEVQLKTEFKESELQKFDDIYLWYRGTRVAQITFNRKRVGISS